MKKKFLFLGFLFIFTACETTRQKTEALHQVSSTSKHENKIFEPIIMKYTYKNLKLNDLDQMMDLIYEKINEYKKTDQILRLKEATLTAYSRPDEDRTLDKIITLVQNPLEDNGEWENTIEAIVQQCISKMNNEKEEPIDQATAGVVLENIIADFKPLFIKQYRSGGFETDIIEQIADANLMYSKLTRAERKLNLMRTNGSPSDIAKRLIAQKNEVLKQEKK